MPARKNVNSSAETVTEDVQAANEQVLAQPTENAVNPAEAVNASVTDTQRQNIASESPIKMLASASA